MDPSDTNKRLAVIRIHITNRELKQAIEGIRELISDQQVWSLSQQIDELENNYRSMLHYLLSGKRDPEQKNIYRQLIRDLYSVADDAAGELMLRNSSTLFYDKMR